SPFIRSHRSLRDGMRRWTNGLPGATQRLGAMMTHRGLSASQPWMRADTHRGPERNRSTSEAEYIDAALTFALSELHLAPHGRAIHLALRGSAHPRLDTTAIRSRADVQRTWSGRQPETHSGHEPR